MALGSRRLAVADLNTKEPAPLPIHQVCSHIYNWWDQDLQLNFFSDGAKNFVGEPFCVSENFILLLKNLMHKRRVSCFSVEKFLSHSTKKFRRGRFLCSRKLLVSKFLGIRGKGVSRFSVALIKLKMLVKAGTRSRSYCFRTLLSYPLCHGNILNFWQKSVNS